MRKYLLFSAVLAALLLVASINACGGGPPSTEPSDEATPALTVEPQMEETMTSTPSSQKGEETKTSTPAPEATEIKLPSEAEQVVQLAREDLTRRLDLAPEEIQVVSVEAVDWPDTSLGCPQPGMMYAQVITPGFRVVLEAEGQRYKYHTDQGQSVVLCEEESMTDVSTVHGSVEPGLEPLVNLAKEDLAERLSIPADQIEVLEASSVVWPDGGLGCPQPGVVYIQVQREGLLIRLRVGQRVYHYHSGGGRPPFLCEHPSRIDDLPPAPGMDDD